MKHLISIFLLLLIVSNLHAQFSENNAIYATGQIYGGNYYGANMSLNYVLNEKYSFQFGITGLFQKSKSKPDDYTSGVTAIFTFGLSEHHFDNLGSFEFLAGRIIKPNTNGTTRWNLSGGLGYTVITKHVNWIPVNSYSFGSNYTYDTVDKGTVSLILCPKVEFPFTQIFGLTISTNLHINTETVYFGVGFGAMLGLLRKGGPTKVISVY